MSASEVRGELERDHERGADADTVELGAAPDEMDTLLGNARTWLEQVNRHRDLRFWPPEVSWSGNQWEATWKSPSGRLDKASYPGQVAMLDDVMERFGVPT